MVVVIGGCFFSFFFLLIACIYGFIFYYIGLGDIIYTIYRGLKLLYAFSYFFIYFFFLLSGRLFFFRYFYIFSFYLLMRKGYSAYFSL